MVQTSFFYSLGLNFFYFKRLASAMSIDDQKNEKDSKYN